MKDALQLYILQTWITMYVKSFIETLVNLTETKIEKQLRGNPGMHLKEHCTKIETMFHLLDALLFLSNLVFKFNSVDWHSFLMISATINLLICHLIKI